jgi:myosin heavy subunit
VRELEQANARLSTAEKEMEAKLETHAKKQRDIIWYLHREIQTRDEELERLKATCAERQASLEKQTRAAQEREEENEKSTETMRRDYEQKLSALRAQYEELERFQKEKTSLEARLAQLEEELRQEKVEHSQHVSELERRNIAEKTRLKKEMLRKVKETKLSLLAMTEDQLHTTTKRVILENEQMTTELQYQSKVTERLLEENSQLKEQHATVARQLELHEDAERILATRTHFFHKLIKKLNERVRTLEAQQATNQTRFGQREREIEEELLRRDDAVRALEQALRKHEERGQRLQSQSEEFRRQAEYARAQLDHLVSLQDEAVTFLLTCMEDVRKQALLAAATAASPPSSTSSASPAEAKTGGSSSPIAASSPTAAAARRRAVLQDRESVLKLLFERLSAYHSRTQEALARTGFKESRSNLLPRIVPVLSAPTDASEAERKD